MKALKVVVVGGVGGGAAFAARARRLSEASKIVVFERGPAASVAYCGMPYYLGGEIPKREDLFVTSEAVLKKRYNLDLRVMSQVEAIDREHKTVSVKNLETGEMYDEKYDKLVLAMGAEAAKLPIQGLEQVKERVFNLRSVEDMDRIKAHVHVGKSAVIVGGGYTGIELAEQLNKFGMKVTLVEFMDQVLPYMDREMVVPLMRAMKKHGVDLRIKQSCTAMMSSSSSSDAQHKVTCTLSSGEKVSADLVVTAAGVRPESRIAEKVGIQVEPRRGGILVNQHMQTNDPDIYACGDLVMINDITLGVQAHIPLASPAAREGRVAANHIFGAKPDVFKGALGTSIICAFGVTVSATGASEKMLQRFQKPYRKVYTVVGNHAGYYPGSQRMTLKLMYEPDSGKILGAQISGGTQGVDARIDAISVAMQAGLTVFDLEETEMAYSPQYGSAKDPVNMLGFIASGAIRGEQQLVHFEDVLGKEDQFAALVDIRTASEVAGGTLKGAKHMPLEEIRARHAELNLPRESEKPIAVYCRIGARGYMGQLLLQSLGYKNVKNISGGYEVYQNHFTEL